ncbi:DUF2218 domain-containing protein [Chachezhania sediminis]|uniref:DUF2218 domain-containing protein n=1 Tax=Chachezhania sediminis TaxID=2599291 RepID=UPI00131B5C63|nr:DUF2218 domain-containing protein [Chachezhania sediminis]
MLSSTGTYATPNASKYLQQLCKHFAHKIEVTYDVRKGECAMPLGPATMTADEAVFTIHVTAPDADSLPRAKSVMDEHLKRFAFRDGFEAMTWQDAPAT